ncbi:hypothetical protein BDV96DRAFT_505414 [Lophiotrema nucula]|uniref:Beta/gamma crystallin 'Greek key' domain-containing protein n=1 Tax=Lophiotrema nucula TaxID=690887 RepID=A0A6A5YL26_9PLEO|nr:hypothetical protein BDV96DRAFT_505414 [Lophiotrema nucula]
MSRFATFALSLLCLGSGVLAAPDDTPYANEARVKVYLFAQPAFYSQVAVDAYKHACVSLDNNLIDGLVQSFLIGGYDIPTVYNRRDDWYCHFYQSYDCSNDGTANTTLTFSDGVNYLGSAGWNGRIHSLRCLVEDV